MHLRNHYDSSKKNELLIYVGEYVIEKNAMNSVFHRSKESRFVVQFDVMFILINFDKRR